MDKEDALREFNERLRANPKSAMVHYGLGLVLEREGKTADALDHFERALSGKPESIPIMFSMGKAYHDDGQYEKSLSILQRALELAPYDKEVLFLSALSLQRLERYSQAAKIYERLSFLPPVKNEVYYNLGLVYGNQGSLALAHYNLGVYFAKLRKGDRALFHFGKAEELSEQNPALREKIHQALRDLKKHHPPK
jgi:tetratricopeptide (TPR) repeat protein